jgi:tetraacyldisaccharide 4'-kinase
VWAQRQLERGAFDGTPARRASALWRRVADPVRPLALPSGARVVGVGGATLGGAGKTPLVLELARRLSARGERVAVVATAYRARPGRARQVSVDDRVEQVGDEGLMLARALAPSVPVVVAPARQDALELAAGLAPLVLVDALLQARPGRLSLSLLVLDASQPWGAGRCPPSGDLRADRERLLAASDAVLLVGSAGNGVRVAVERLCRRAGRPLFEVPARLRGARTPEGTLLGVEELSRRRVGLALAVAHPERIVAALRASGIVPAPTCFDADHGVPAPDRADPAPEAWLATAKCATKLDREARRAPVWVLEQALEPPGELLSLVAGGKADVRGLCPEKPW